MNNNLYSWFHATTIHGDRTQQVRTNLVTIGWLQVKTGDVKGNAELRVELQEHRIACEHLTQRALDAQEISAPVVDSNDTVTGHIISMTIGGKNEEPKQVLWWAWSFGH
ncbi:unnamed protein product [Camellia sinensis]